jgi:hypothetical protein
MIRFLRTSSPRSLPALNETVAEKRNSESTPKLLSSS